MADAANQIAQAGHLVKIMAGGLEVGWAKSSSFSQDYGTEGLYAIGSVGPFEPDPLRWSAQITLDQFVIHRAKMGQAIQMLNLAPMGPEDTLRAGVIDFEILDENDTTIMVYEECTIQSFSYQVNANAFSGQNAVFLAKNVRAGAQPQMGLTNGPVGQPANS
jgi:hypothetical protein